ncbi:helix-turn-helix domain-containing protein [uncultured Cellulomonas sp.]|uniref:helix-turn-helix domain-containing protein n=1 Tax=uncultured Cellulomonas sp. TaxID=189682 RepID=UPI0028EEC509|nr:helix-turn-helix domain-containing protein [uncultured Cellulomonas sp.]
MNDDDSDHTPRLMLTVADAARRLSIGRSSCYRLISSGEIQSVHIGKLHRVPVDSLVAFVSRCTERGTTPIDE